MPPSFRIAGPKLRGDSLHASPPKGFSGGAATMKLDRGNSTSPRGRSEPKRRSEAPLYWALTIFLILQVGAGIFLVPKGGAEDLVRIAGLLVLTPFVWQQGRRAKSIDDSNRNIRLRQEALFQRFLVGYLLWALAGTLVHGEVLQFVTHLGGAVFLMIIVRVLASDGGVAAARLLPIVLGSAVALSLGVGLLDPTQGVAGGRLRGIFINANLLGFYAFIALVCGLLLVRGRWWSLFLCGASIVALVWTGSRTSAIAAAAALLLLALFGHRRSRWVVLPALGIGVLGLIGIVDWGASPLLRTLDTRDGSLDEAMRVLSLSPLTGVGVGGELVEVASSPLRAFVQGGMIALLGVLIMYVVLLREAVRRDTLLLAVSLAAILSSLGEGWFLSSLGSMLIVFVSAWIGISSRTSRFGRAVDRTSVR